MAITANDMQDHSRSPGAETGTPLVYVSILNWNGYLQTEECLSSLFRMDYPNYKVVIVDNGSEDGSVAHLAKWVTEYPNRVTLLTNESNTGFTGGHNLAINFGVAAGADYVWLVNNDVTVRPNALTTLIAAASREADIGLLSPVICYTTLPDQVWNCGALLDVESGRCDLTDDITTARNWLVAEPRRFMVCGAAMLICRVLIEKIGLLDDSFFAYCEDMDYSIRSADAGFRNILVEKAVVYHDKTPTMEDELAKPHYHYFMIRNDFMLMRKHARRWRGVKGKLWYTRRVLRTLEQSQQDTAVRQASLTALWDVWSGTTGQFDPLRRMPWPLRSMLGSWPGFWRRLLEAF